MSLMVPKTPTSVNLGRNAGGNLNTVAIGTDAGSGSVSQGAGAVAIGVASGIAGGQSSVSVGDTATATGLNSVAIGYNATVSLSTAGVAIGAMAKVDVYDEAIVINGTNTPVSAPGPHTFVVHPVSVRASGAGLLPLYYDTTTYEIVALNPGVLLRVTYDKNGAGGSAPDWQSAAYNTTVILPSPLNLIPPPGTSIFQNWNTKKNGTGTAYLVGGSYTVLRNTTFYAIYA